MKMCIVKCVFTVILKKERQLTSNSYASKSKSEEVYNAAKKSPKLQHHNNVVNFNSL